MGTRGLTMVIRKGKPKIAQYGQWDHYPSGQGVTALKFLRRVNLEKFKAKVDTLKFMGETEENEIKEFLESIGSKDGWLTMEQSNLYKLKFPFLSRDNGAEILSMVMKSKSDKIYLRDSSDFAADSLFCEYAYVIDLDKNRFEVYEGFNQKPLGKKERFYKLQQAGKHEEEHRTDTYYPVRLLKSFSLDMLPTPAKFVKELTPKEEEA